MSLQVNLFDATDGTVIDGDAVRADDAETARRDFRETVLAYFETDGDGGQLRCLFAGREGGGGSEGDGAGGTDGTVRPVLAQARWDHDGYAGVDKPAWANFTQFVTGEIETSNWAFVEDDLTENVFRKLNNRTIDPTEAGDSQLDRPLGDDTAHIRAPSTPTAVAVFNHFARQEYDVPFSAAVCESVPAHLRDSLTVLVTTDDGLAKPVVERFESATADTAADGATGDAAVEQSDGGAADAPTEQSDGDAGAGSPADPSPEQSPNPDAADRPPAVGGSRQGTDDGSSSRRPTDDDGVPRGSPRADELPNRADHGVESGESGADGGGAGGADGSGANDGGGVDGSGAGEESDGVTLPREVSDDADGAADASDDDIAADRDDLAEASPAREAPADDTADESATDLADEEFPLLDEEEADAFLSGATPEEDGVVGGAAADADTDDDFDTASEFDTTVDFDSGDFDADFDTDTGFDQADELGGEDDGISGVDSTEDGLGDDPLDGSVADDTVPENTPADSIEPDSPAVQNPPADDTATDDSATDDTAAQPDDRDPVAEFVAETEERPSADAIPESVREDTPPAEADDDAGFDDAAATEPTESDPGPVDTGPIGSTTPNFDDIDPDGSAVESGETHAGRAEAITGVAPDAAYDLRIFSGPTGRLQYSTERESARVDQQAKWDYDNGLSLAVVPSEGVVRAYFNASRNGPEQFLAEFRCEQVAGGQLLETFVETLEATLAEQDWELLEEAGGRQLLYNHMLTATPFDPDLSGANLDELLADGPVDFVVPTHAKAVELFRWVRSVAPPETTVVVCGAGRTERTESADVVIQKDAGVGGVAVTGAAERRLEEQTRERAVRETREAFRTVAEAVYREADTDAGGVDADAAGNETADDESDTDPRLDTWIADLLTDRVPDEQSLAFTAAGSRARRYETAAGWGVVGYAVAAAVSALLAVAVGAFDTELAGLATAVPVTGTLIGGGTPPAWIPTLPLGVVLFVGLAVLGVAVARPAATHPLARGLVGRVRSWWAYPPVSESALFDGSQIELLDANGAEDTVENRLQRLRAAYDGSEAGAGTESTDESGYRAFVADTILTEPPLDALSVAPRTETRRRRLSTVGGGAAVGVLLGLQTTAAVSAALGIAATSPDLVATITLLAVLAVGAVAVTRRVGDDRELSLATLFDEFR